jgi:hypothetical protein
MKKIKLLAIDPAPTPPLRLVNSPAKVQTRSAGDALADALGLQGWLAGPGPWIQSAVAEVDRQLASDACEHCLTESTLAVAVHELASRRYKVFSVCPHCNRLAEV